jgi:transposase
MIQLTLFPDRVPGPRWISPPLTTASDRWLEIDSDLPADHPARRIAELVAALDLSPLVRSYAGLGSPAHPPELLVRLALFEIHRGRLSPAQWFEDCRYDDAVKWLAFGLRPSRSCLYQFRDRIGPFVDLWNRSVLRAAKAEGWTPVKRASLDGTFAASYASRHTPIEAKPLARRCQQLEAAVAADFAGAGRTPPEPASGAEVAPTTVDHPGRPEVLPELAPTAEPTPVPTAEVAPTAEAASPSATVPAWPSTPTENPAWMAKTPAGRFGQWRRYRRAQETSQGRREHREATMGRRSKAKRRDPERIKVSLTDPEAPPGLDKTKVFRPLFDVQLACDLDSRFILGHDVFAATSDANLLGPMLQRARELTGTTPEVVLNDGIYANILNLKLCDEQGVTMYAPLPRAPSPPAVPGPTPIGAGGCGAEASGPAPAPRITKSDFTWLPEMQTYRCPAGHTLVLERRGIQQRTDGELVESQYRCPPEHCRACPLAGLCARSPEQGRIVKRSEHDDLLDALRQRMSQPEGRAIYRLRKQTVERQFADVKRHRGLRQFASFGLERARIQVGLVVLAHNGLELLKARSRATDEGTPSRRVG